MIDGWMDGAVMSREHGCMLAEVQGVSSTHCGALGCFKCCLSVDTQTNERFKANRIFQAEELQPHMCDRRVATVRP